MEGMSVVITEHARKRLNDMRQSDISLDDIIAASIPGQITSATRFHGFFARSGRMFDLVAKDVSKGRLVITVIGE